MYRSVMHVVCAVALSIFGLMGVSQAVSLGKVDVASHLGESFYGEVPLGLDDGEVISSVFVELASPADYRILEVFRDQALNSIRADVKSDSRGSRIELTSSSALESPFFNLVLKVRHGRATHFKKYAVFLDLPRAAISPKKPALPIRKDTDPVKMLVEPDAVEKIVDDKAVKEDQAFKAYDGWARTAQYGPMVFGDTVTTVAQRLRVDERYSNQQVMVALFEKNKAKFDQNNINLIKAGTYLNVPTAAEVELVSRQQARDVLREHNRKWKDLTKQSKYAKVKSAQESRYSKRVHMGEQGSGVAAKPLSAKNTAAESHSEALADPEVHAVVHEQSIQGENSGLNALRAENDNLKQRLSNMEKKIAELLKQPTASEALAASENRIKKLELQLARQANDLEKARKQAGVDGDLGLLTWLLIGVIGLLSMIAAYLIYALRGQRKHPVEQETPQSVEPEEEAAAELLESVDENMDFSETETISSDAEAIAGDEEILSDSLPDLTDEETSEMEAFKEADEEPDPNVDYLSEADVYMRYGMEDEAEKQVQMALLMREDNKDAHVKLVQIRHARGNHAGVEEAANVARATLQGSTLEAFVEAYDDLTGGTEETSLLDDTMPPTVLETPSDDIDDGTLAMDEFELPDFAEADTVESDDGLEKPDKESDEAGLDDLNLSDIEWSDSKSDAMDEPESDVGVEAVDETEASELKSADEKFEAEELDVDDLLENSDLLSGLELPSDSPIQGAEAVSEGDDLVAELDNDTSLDLSDLEVTDTSLEKGEDELSVAASIDELDLDNTVVMDWSKDTSIIQDGVDPGSESGASEAFLPEEQTSSDVVADKQDISSADLAMDLSDLSLDDAASSDDIEDDGDEDEPEEHLSSIELNLDDLDVDLAAVEHDADIEEFTSTIQATLTELGVDESDVEILPADEPDTASESPAMDDFDASLELESLLSDLEELQNDDDDKKTK